VSIDGVPVPAAVIGLPRTVDPGHHVVVVKTQGAEGQHDVDLREGDTKSIEVALVPTASPSGPSGPPPAEKAQAAVPPSGPASDAPVADTPSLRSHAPDALTWIGGGVAGAGLVVGAVTGAMSWSKTSSLASECPAHTCPPASYASYDSASSLATISTVSFVVGGVGACLAVVSLVVGHEEKSEPASTSPSAQLRVSPWIAAGAAGLRGSF
jgi:hypothetical protein